LKLWYSNSLKFYKPTFYKSIELHVLVIFYFKVFVIFNCAVKNPSLLAEGTLKTGYGENTEHPPRVGALTPLECAPACVCAWNVYRCVGMWDALTFAPSFTSFTGHRREIFPLPRRKKHTPSACVWVLVCLCGGNDVQLL